MRCLGLFLISAASFLVLTAVNGCKDNGDSPPCLDCASTKIKRSFSDLYFRVGLNATSEPYLFPIDTATLQSSPGLGYCPLDDLDQLEVIQASGSVYIGCNNADSFYIAKSFRHVLSCPIPIPNIVGQFSLKDRTWYVDSLYYSGDTYLPPCGSAPNVKFSSAGKYSASLVLNSTLGDFIMHGTDSISISQGAVTLLVVYPRYQRDFESAFLNTIGIGINQPPSTYAKIELWNNHLKLTTANGAIILHSTS